MSAPSHAQTVQATLSVALTAEFSVPTANGSKIEKVRVSTRDLVDEIKAELGITRSGGSLVTRRQIGDFDSPVETFLIVNKVAYPVPDEPIDDIEVELPESYFAYVEAVKRRKSDFVETEVKILQPTAFGLGNLEEDGFEATLVGLEKVTLKLLTKNGVDIGYLVSSNSATVTGGMVAEDFAYGEIDAVVTGKLSSSSEKIVP
ncbi:MAG: hypothetical protein WEF50_20585 [Myxococcota bacterium]